VKSVESALPILKSFSTRKILTRKISKAFIPCFWSLLKPIERLMEFVNMVRIFIIFKVRRLFHIDFLFDRSVQEISLDVHLIKLEIMVTSIGK
jgi:hypothetical protein